MTSTHAEYLRTKFLSLTPDVGIIDAFLEAVPHQRLAHTPRLGLVVIAPETFALGVGSALARRIGRDGFRILDVRVRRLTAEDTSAMFVPNWIPERFRWWLIQQRFAMGASAALLVTADGEPDCSRALSSVKGNRLPALAPPGTWRGDFPSLNGVLDLVHTADDFCHLLRNAAPFYSPADLVSAIDAVVAGRPARPAAADLLGLYDAAGSCTAFEIVLLQVQGRLLAHADLREGELLRRVVRTLTLVRAEHEHRIVTVRSGGVPGARSAGLVAELRETLDELRRHSQTLPAEHPVRLLARLAEAPGVAWHHELARLRLSGMVADAWEELVLLSTLYYADQELPHLSHPVPGGGAPTTPSTAPISRMSRSDADTGS